MCNIFPVEYSGNLVGVMVPVSVAETAISVVVLFHEITGIDLEICSGLRPVLLGHGLP